MRHLTASFCLFLAAISIAQADQLFDNGAPDLMEGSEITHWREADRFTVSEPVILGNVRFWDFQAVPGAFSGSILCEVRANTGNNTPGAVLYSGTAINLSRVATGRFALFVNWPEFVNTFELPSVTLPAGTYWLVLHNGPLSNNAGQDLFWEAAINLSTDPSRSDVAPFLNQWQSNSSSSQPLSKLAFQLFGILESARPRITAVERSGEGARITFNTVAGRNYRIEYQNALSHASWATLPGAEDVPGTAGSVQVVDSGSSQLQRRFYRVVLQPSAPPAPVVPAAEVSRFWLGMRSTSTKGSPANSVSARRPRLRVRE